MEENNASFFSALSRENLKNVWRIAQADLRAMPDEDQLMAFIMKEHPEFKTYWDNLDEFLDYEFDAENEINPFMHVTIHQIVENQIRNESPPDVERVFQGLKDKGLERHDAIHAIGAVLVEYMFDVLQDQQPIDEAKYLRDLQQMLKETQGSKQ